MSLQRWKLTLAYDGAAYAGWQYQNHSPTVQNAVEQAILKFCGQFIRVHVAGRTDAGVHANGQVCHFDLDYGGRELSGFNLMKALNAHLAGETVVVLKAEAAPPEFHARFSAINKLYCYRVVASPSRPLFDTGRVWYKKKKLDALAMQEAAQYLLGVHDFTSFRAAECQAKTPVKTLDRADIVVRPYNDLLGEFAAEEYDFYFEGRSFLHHQVRNMVGTLMLVGEGKWQKQDIKTALEARDRAKGGITAPPEGLSLLRVDY